MGASTGPVAAVTAISYANAVVLHGKPWHEELPIIVGGAIAAGALYLLEQAAPNGARAFAWLLLVGVLFTRVDPAVPSPIESLTTWVKG